jgi:hypothetical protein
MPSSQNKIPSSQYKVSSSQYNISTLQYRVPPSLCRVSPTVRAALAQGGWSKRVHVIIKSIDPNHHRTRSVRGGTTKPPQLPTLRYIEILRGRHHDCPQGLLATPSKKKELEWVNKGPKLVLQSVGHAIGPFQLEDPR